MIVQESSGGSLGELSSNDLSGLDTHLDETEDIFNQLADPSFELEQFFDFTDEKVLTGPPVRPNGKHVASLIFFSLYFHFFTHLFIFLANQI